MWRHLFWDRKLANTLYYALQQEQQSCCSCCVYHKIDAIKMLPEYKWNYFYLNLPYWEAHFLTWLWDLQGLLWISGIKWLIFFSLKSFLKCQAQILVHFVIEGQIASPFITPASSYSHVWFHCLPRNLRWIAAYQVTISSLLTSQQLVTEWRLLTTSESFTVWS